MKDGEGGRDSEGSVLDGLHVSRFQVWGFAVPRLGDASAELAAFGGLAVGEPQNPPPGPQRDGPTAICMLGSLAESPRRVCLPNHEILHFHAQEKKHMHRKYSSIGSEIQSMALRLHDSQPLLSL